MTRGHGSWRQDSTPPVVQEITANLLGSTVQLGRARSGLVIPAVLTLTGVYASGAISGEDEYRRCGVLTRNWGATRLPDGPLCRLLLQSLVE